MSVKTKSILFVGFLTLFSISLVFAGDGKITFATYYLKENKEITYRKSGQWVPEGLQAINTLFRSRDSDSVHEVDPKLLELIDQIEDHFQVRQVEVISGFRSVVFNQSLKDTGRGVANESYHTKGMACDIHLDEITEEAVRDYALSLGKGGVGYYPALNMVHVDVGPVRTWAEKGERKEWVGEENKSAGFRVQVAPTIMKKIVPLQMRVIGNGPALSLAEGQLEFFKNNVWEKAATVSEYGKYRYRFLLKDGAYQLSNEFYYKRM